MTAFFDTSAVIALANPSEPYHAWSLNEFTSRQADGPIVISDVVYAEVSAAYASQEEIDAIVAKFGFERSLREDGALFSAGQRYKLYRKNHGQKTNVLPDFFIGADAHFFNLPIVTANPKDFRTFFSGLTIVHPAGEEVVP